MHGAVDTTGERPGAVHLPDDTRIGAVRLTVSDLQRSVDFYERALGLRQLSHDGVSAALGVAGESPLVELREDRIAPARDPRAPGLFHLAILVPDRGQLAMALARLADARVPLHGASDHLVSEALYLADPDGNGIEIYRDRPRAEWPQRDGQLAMATLPLDLDDLLSELSGSPSVAPGAPAGTTMGHVHLQVADLGQAEAFYVGLLGFDVTVRGYPGALFVSAGGYHHQVGLNTWHSAGGSAPPPGSIGLRHFEVVLPSAREVEGVADRIRSGGAPVEPQPDGLLVRDPWGTGVLLRTS